jgi:phosphatidylglycerol---prolipoprotein diacylglyceryl transferase
MLDFLPNPIAFQLGPLTIGWYGLAYVVGLAVAYQVLVRLARRAGEDPDVVGNGMIVVAIAALIGGRVYHVIDKWSLYQDDLLKIVLPPYSGLGVYGGIATGLIAVVVFARVKGLPFWRWADIIAPALFAMQAVARWGNFFNQELYGPPTTLPWGIPIDCAYRILAYPCETFPVATTRFHPLFLYESLSGLIGAIVVIWLGFRLRRWLRPGDLILVFFAWYGIVRFGVETLRQDSWTFFDIPMAQIVSLAFAVPAIVGLIWRHRPGHGPDEAPSRSRGTTWGALGSTDDVHAEATDTDEFDDDAFDDDEGGEDELHDQLERPIADEDKPVALT